MINKKKIMSKKGNLNVIKIVPIFSLSNGEIQNH
jgi:hypothetical protein